MSAAGSGAEFQSDIDDPIKVLYVSTQAIAVAWSGSHNNNCILSQLTLLCELPSQLADANEHELLEITIRKLIEVYPGIAFVRYAHAQVAVDLSCCCCPNSPIFRHAYQSAAHGVYVGSSWLARTFNQVNSWSGLVMSEYLQQWHLPRAKSCHSRLQ